VRGDEGTLFLIAFQDLKNAIDNSPSALDEQWKDRDDLKELCDRLDGYRRSFDIAEEWTAVSFTPHVPAAASKARREFEEHWQALVARIADRNFWVLFGDLFPDGIVDVEPTDDPLGREIEGWQYGARNDAENIKHAFAYLIDRRSWDEDGDFDWVDETERSWDRLIKIVGLDLKGAFWRRNAIPHILFPSHVSNHYGPEKASIYRRLHDAARAFTFGAPFAALAMQRAVLEQLLKGHWGSAKGWVRDANLPTLALDARAERLKRVGDQALHGDPEKLSTDELDRQIIRNFLLLRELIEGAPESRQ
jgi:hypothetical protein